ncbi:MAG: hypothetical protein SCARUB_00523 [Candidatus Scalindua rubra]|uniref:Uncharacterized protein n=1 Tax=Candidatus Scalindua rubra TaxID=1872076 RepID=A0A1E3XFH1_9BACT|nr:MAG: hypothetical protein SCARUB_00523 [Candidatus Scalindua rubra]
MSILLIVFGALAYIACGMLAYGQLFGCMQNRYPESAEEEREFDQGLAFIFALLGPIGLFITYVVLTGRGKYGIKFR